MNIALFLEGGTERALPEFFKRWLDPQLAKSIGLTAVVPGGSGEYLKTFARRAELALRERKVVAVVGLLDLYRCPLDFSSGLTTNERCDWAKAALEKQVGHPGFRQHFAVHETEAWLLSDPSILPSVIRSSVDSIANPEGVDLHDPPSRLLRSLYRGRLRQEYGKVTDGTSLFRKLDPTLAYRRCPHLRLLLDDLLSLAKAAGF